MTSIDPLDHEWPSSPDGYRVVKTFMNLQGRHTAHVEREDGSGGCLGYSWSTYEAAVTDAVAYLEGAGRR